MVNEIEKEIIGTEEWKRESGKGNKRGNQKETKRKPKGAPPNKKRKPKGNQQKSKRKPKGKTRTPRETERKNGKPIGNQSEKLNTN